MIKRKYKVSVSTQVFVEAKDWREAQKKVEEVIRRGELDEMYQEETHVEHVTELDEDWKPI